MIALITYDSVYGNTDKIAQAIAENLIKSNKVEMLHADKVNLSKLESTDLLIVGSPTHGGRPTQAIQRFLTKIPANALKNVSVTAFDTRMGIFFTKLFGYAANRIANSLKDKGGHLAASPEGFIVDGKKGPLKKGELERAADWAKSILRNKK